MEPIDLSATKTGQLTLEHLTFAARKILTDYDLAIAPEVEMMYDHAMMASIMEIRAKVIAARSDEGPYEVENKQETWVTVPLRPVRDGLLMAARDWLFARSGHTRTWRVNTLNFRVRRRVYMLGQWLDSKVQTRRIVTRRVVTMKHVHYYGCPHINIQSKNHEIHLFWMGRMSKQIPDGIVPADNLPAWEGV